MLKFSIVVCVVLWSGPAVAITWEFDDGTAQGWSAKEASLRGGTRELHLFPGEVEEGVWRIAVAPSITKSYYPSQSVEIGFSYHWVRFGSVRPSSRPVPHRP